MGSECGYHLETMNIELTTKCPLSCPQCYCSLAGGKDIPLEIAVQRIREAAGLGVKDVMLSGGETLCYPYLYDVIKAAGECCLSVNVALSGVGFDRETLQKLINAGVTGIFISLNGSTEEINSISRDGYAFAIRALKLLQESSFPNTTINWVMHSSNADDFPNVVKLAEDYGVRCITILGLKPDSRHTLTTFPTREQMMDMKKFLRAYNGTCMIQIESCFSPMLALYCDTKLFGNFNVSEYNGCNAGKTTVSVSVDGLFSPCRHLDFYESFDSIKEYMERSKTQAQIRELSGSRAAPCCSCRLKDYCRPCLAINEKLCNELCYSFTQCPIYEPI